MLIIDPRGQIRRVGVASEPALSGLRDAQPGDAIAGPGAPMLIIDPRGQTLRVQATAGLGQGDQTRRVGRHI
jgi:hypothetical protein